MKFICFYYKNSLFIVVINSCFLTRMGFHITEATCYLTDNLFYVEVVLFPDGEVEEVKVAPHGKPPSVS